MRPSISVVIATIGRRSLAYAVQSTLDQTYPVDEILVVAEPEAQVSVPDDNRIKILTAPPGHGPARSRQLGIDEARGTSSHCSTTTTCGSRPSWPVNSRRSRTSTTTTG